MSANVTVRTSALVRASAERVWDYTQDYAHRTEWDRAVLEAEVLVPDPLRVRLRLRGGVRATFQYKQRDRPNRTSLVATELEGSWLVTGGGGSWEYVAVPGGTEWRRQDTLRLRNGALAWLLGWAVRWALRREAEAGFARVKAALEGEPGCPPASS